MVEKQTPTHPGSVSSQGSGMGGLAFCFSRIAWRRAHSICASNVITPAHPHLHRGRTHGRSQHRIRRELLYASSQQPATSSQRGARARARESEGCWLVLVLREHSNWQAAPWLKPQPLLIPLLCHQRQLPKQLPLPRRLVLALVWTRPPSHAFPPRTMCSGTCLCRSRRPSAGQHAPDPQSAGGIPRRPRPLWKVSR